MGGVNHRANFLSLLSIFFLSSLFSVSSKVCLSLFSQMTGVSEFTCEEGMCTGSWSCAHWKPLSDHTDDPGSNPGKAIPGAEVSEHMVLTEYWYLRARWLGVWEGGFGLART